MPKVKIFLALLTVFFAALAVLTTYNGFMTLYRAGQIPMQQAQAAGIDVNPETTFSIVVLPDTQIYAQYYPETFCDQTEWISANASRLNIIFVTHVGDIINRGAVSKKEWKTASDCMGVLDGKVPYSVVPGNHDVDVLGYPNATFNAFNTTFPVSRFEAYPWYRGNYNNNQNSYQVVPAADSELLFLSLEVDAPDDVLTWADGVLKAHPDTQAIITTHSYIDDGTGQRNPNPVFRPTNSAEDIWNKLIRSNCNVLMVMSGHFHDNDGESKLESLNDCGGTVYQVLQDYQARESGGNGRLRIYNFNTPTRTIDAQTYSPKLDQYEVDEDSQFTLFW